MGLGLGIGVRFRVRVRVRVRVIVELHEAAAVGVGPRARRQWLESLGTYNAPPRAAAVGSISISSSYPAP